MKGDVAQIQTSPDNQKYMNVNNRTLDPINVRICTYCIAYVFVLQSNFNFSKFSNDGELYTTLRSNAVQLCLQSIVHSGITRSLKHLDANGDTSKL